MRRRKDNDGLLSKVVQVRHEPDDGLGRPRRSRRSDRESEYAKQMLKEMIERKRRNDFVRKREFDMLRKMRRER